MSVECRMININWVGAGLNVKNGQQMTAYPLAAVAGSLIEHET